jgi:hypothetical protein
LAAPEPAATQGADAAPQQDDLIMLLGLVGLFAAFGAVLGYFVFFVS